MRELTVRTSTGEYQVWISNELAESAIQSADLILIDRLVQDDVLQLDKVNLIDVQSNEETKTLAGCEEVLTRLHQAGARRDSKLLAIGGGAVQDVATLVASLYMRGIPWIYVPSTVMAMTDSCIGGKSSINVSGIKNLVGNIYPPESVFLDPSLARNLDVGAKVSGLAEAVKICFAKGLREFDIFLRYEMSAADFGLDSETDDLLHHVLSCKKWFIEVDEFDKRERQLLNFGHTYAHALESASGFNIPHGVAVGIGVLAATHHPLSATGMAVQDLQQYTRMLLEPVAERVGQIVDDMDWRVFDQALSSDKKGTRTEIRVVLPSSRGGVETIGMPRDSSSLLTMRVSLERALMEVSL